MGDIRLAWRNIWRNKRRTLLTAASVFLAIFLALIVQSLQIGWFDRLIDITVKSHTGHIQIHRKGYWDDRDINNAMIFSDSLAGVVSHTGNVDRTVPRLEYFALASCGKQTKGVMLTGTDPAREDAMTRLIISRMVLHSLNTGIMTEICVITLIETTHPYAFEMTHLRICFQEFGVRLPE